MKNMAKIYETDKDRFILMMKFTESPKFVEKTLKLIFVNQTTKYKW